MVFLPDFDGFSVDFSRVVTRFIQGSSYKVQVTS